MPTQQVARKRRSNRGVPQNRRHAVGTNPQQNLTRRFIYQERITLDNATGSNTSHASFQTFNPLSIQGFSDIARTFEQYRVKRVRAFLTSSLPLFDTSATPSAITRNLMRLPSNSNASTTVMTAVDHTPGDIAGPNIYAYNNVQFRIPDLDFATKIADFVPRIDDPNLVRPTNNFISTESTVTRWNGFQLYVTNNGAASLNSVWSDPTYQQTFLIRYELDVEFKQPSYRTTGPLARLPEVPSVLKPSAPPPDAPATPNPSGMWCV